MISFIFTIFIFRTGHCAEDGEAVGGAGGAARRHLSADGQSGESVVADGAGRRRAEAGHQRGARL